MGVKLNGARIKKPLSKGKLADREAFRKNAKRELEAERNRPKKP